MEYISKLDDFTIPTVIMIKLVPTLFENNNNYENKFIIFNY